MKRTNRWLMLTALLLALLLAVSSAFAGGSAVSAKNKKKKNTPTPRAAVTATATPTAKPTPTPDAPAVATPSPVPDGAIIDPQSIADYIFAHGCLPDNFVTKREAQDAGWDSSYNYLSDVLPGKSIGGSRFGNYEGKLPDAPGRKWYECDCYYTRGKRNAYRVVYSSDGLVYYTGDHYNTFTQLFRWTDSN